MRQPVPLPNSELLQTTTCKNSGSTVLTTTRSWDRGVRLSAILNQTNGGGVVTSHSYQYDSAGRRTRAALEDGSMWVYDYNDRDELTGARRYWADWSPVSGQFFGYDYDNIGNRKIAWAGGDVNGANLHQTTYTANALNQYTAISNPGYEHILGVALATNTLTVNGATADRKTEYFHREITVSNNSGPCWQDVNATSSTASSTGGIISAAATQTLVYDADADLTFDGLWTYTWDAENRLVSMSMTNVAAGSLPDLKRYRLDFAYDHGGRRISKTVSHWDGASFTEPVTTLSIHDGSNLLVELDGAQTLLRAYLWGQDLSGSLDQAAGIGGLILLTLGGSTSTNCFVTYDGNASITALVDADTQALQARYEHGPFGTKTRGTGQLAQVNPFGYSTKFGDAESGLTDYGRRLYSPLFGRWLQRDAAEEQGGKNLYGFVNNSPCNTYDTDGCWPVNLAGWVGLGAQANWAGYWLGLTGLPGGNTAWPVAMSWISKVNAGTSGTLLGGVGMIAKKPVLQNAWVGSAVAARLAAVAAVGGAAADILAGKVPRNQDDTAGLAYSFVNDSRRSNSTFAELDAVLLGLSVAVDAFNDPLANTSLVYSLVTGNASGIASALPSYTALNAWDMLEDISPNLEGL